MGLFDLLKRGNKSYDIGATVIGYLRAETSKHLGLSHGSKEYESACASAAEKVESFLLPALTQDKENQQALVDTLSKACGSRFNECFGEYLILLWVRYGVIQHAIAQGKVKPEEATLSVLSLALHRQIKRLVDLRCQ